MDLLDGLNEQQRAAVTAGEGPILVLAGPGSGKTRVLTHRIAYLVREMDVSPYHIMAVTFTNKAAKEMRGRVEELLDGRLRGLRIGTFHATCARLLRIESNQLEYGDDYAIYDSDDQLAVVKQAMGELSVDTKRFRPRAILSAISKAKTEMITPGAFTALDYFGEAVSRVYPRYQAILLDNNAMDFGDLLLQMVLLLRQNDAVREKYQERFGFVLVDEFQDTNAVQYELVQLFGNPQNNIFAVGDEDQSIYAFRGADYRNVLQFREDYPDAKVILLEQNYRSTQVVLDAARAVIDKNSNRTPKSLFTERSGGELVTVEECYNENYEAEYIVEAVNKLLDEGYEYNDFAVMYRTNAQSRAIEDACVSEAVPYKLVGGVGFYKRREIRDLLAYLRLVHNPNDSVSFTRVVNVPRRGIGKKSVQDFQQWVATEQITYQDAFQKLAAGEPSPLPGRAAKNFAAFGEMLAEWKSATEPGKLVELLDAITSRIGYNMYLQTISDNPDQAVERSENVRELRALLAQQDEDEIPLGDFLVEQALVADIDTLDEGANAITLLTLHSAKGLEFPVVFITGLEEGMLPHSRAFDEPGGMEEERRLMYVGVTRAKDRLFLTYAFRRTMWGNSNANASSSFLADIPPELTKGLSAAVSHHTERRSYREQTTWETSRLDRDLQAAKEREGNSAIRSKIVPFPGHSSRSTTQYKASQRVHHPIFGAGMVIESKLSGDDEEVTVAFEDKKHGVKRLIADSANLTVVKD